MGHINRFFYWMVVLCIALVLYGCGYHTIQSFANHPVVTQRPPIKTPSVAAIPTVRVVDGPTRLVIPAISVDAAIEPIGIMPNGTLGTADQQPWIDVGWYKTGPQPGARGSAVIDGHVDRPGGAHAVFWSLSAMQPGNEVIVIMASGKRLHFHVTRVAFYAPQDAPLQDIFANTGGNYLNLITCGGTWIPDQHQTTLRVVVFTSLNVK